MHGILVGVKAKLAEFGVNRLFRHSLHGPLVAQAVTNQIRNRADLEVVLSREGFDLRAARHAAVVIHQFAEHAGRLQPCENAEIHRGLRMSCSHQHAALARAQRKDVAGARKILRRRRWTG
jgi:hypothetical protein